MFSSAEIQNIVEMDNLILRNLKITQTYHNLTCACLRHLFRGRKPTPSRPTRFPSGRYNQPSWQKPLGGKNAKNESKKNVGNE